MSAVVINIDTSLTDVPTIEVGKQGENGATQVVFDVSEMIETYGSGTAYVVVQRRGDAEPYLLDNTSQSGNKVTWTVSNVDTDVYGTGRVQLFWMINEQVAKTVTYQFYVEEALHDPQDAPVVPGGWISDEIGNLDNLTTTAKANLVAAINEVNSKATTNTTAIGTLANLTTTEKGNLVGAINEVNEDVSDVKEDLIASNTHDTRSVEIWTNKGDNFVEGYLHSSGVVSPASDAYVTDYFEVEAEMPIFIKKQYGDTGQASSVCFYDSNKTKLSYHHKIMDARRSIGVIAPANAKYCRFDFLRAFPNPVAYANRAVNIVPNNKNSNDVVLGEIKSAHVVIGSPSASEFVTGWLGSNGAVIGSEAKTSRYIKLQSSNPIIKHWGRRLYPSTELICFYDDELNLVLFSSNSDSAIEIPDGASYFSYSIGDTYTDDDYYLTQLQTVAVPTKAQLNAQGAKTGLSQCLNVAYRGLLAGFGNSQVALRVFGTKNFHYFEEIGLPYRPTKGFKGCRDPFIVIYGEWFYFFYSNAISYLTEQNSFGVCRTKDFENYEEFDPVVTNPDFKMCWAPSVFEENGNYYLTISGSTTSYLDCDTYIYDLDMNTLTVSNERAIEIGNSRRKIDFHFYKFNGYYYAVGKYDDLGNTVIGRSATLNGPYEVLANHRYTASSEEGPMLIRLDNGAYRLYVNDYVNCIVNYVDIPDINNPTQNVGALKAIVSNSPINLFHVSVVDFNRAYSFESV